MAQRDDHRQVAGDLSGADLPGLIDVDEGSLRKGKGRMLAGIVLAAVAAVVALGLYLSSGGERPHAALGKEVNGLDREHFAGFWGCVLQGHDLRRIKSDQDLRHQVHERASRGRARFGAYARDDCLPRLAKLEPALAAVVAPPLDDELAQALRDMRDGVARLRGGWSDYIAHLDGLDDEPYDREAAADPVGRIARAWYDYRLALGALNGRIKAELER